MNLLFLVLGLAVMALLLERIVIYTYVHKRKRSIPFGVYYALGVYKPFLVAAAITAYLVVQREDLPPVLVMLGLTIMTPLVSYPIARFLYDRSNRGRA
jgi:hypothetical protein